MFNTLICFQHGQQPSSKPERSWNTIGFYILRYISCIGLSFTALGGIIALCKMVLTGKFDEHKPTVSMLTYFEILFLAIPTLWGY
jgi:hypothetical protein